MPRTTSAADRARRLIALLGRLENGARLSIDELAADLGISARELAGDLDALSMCGVAPYDPLAMVPIIVEDGFVEVFGDVPAVRGAIRLSSAEATALVAALQAAGFTADDPLTTKLLEASTSDFDAAAVEHTVRAAIATHDRDVYETIAASARDRAVVQIEYASSGSDTTACRRIEPSALFAERGAWYVNAWCRTADDRRTFRIDRIRIATATGETFEPREESGAGATAFDTTGLPVALLRFSAGEEFTEREWPGARISGADSDGATIVEVPYAGTGWIARRVAARLGSVVVLGPAEVRDAVREIAHG